MKTKPLFVLILCLSVIAFLGSLSSAAPKKEIGPPAHANPPDFAPVTPQGGKTLTVLNPSGQPPVRPVKPMAPRLDTLEGKRIYVSSINFPYTNDFVVALADALQEEYSEAEWVFALKYGSYGTDDPALWQEIKENGDAMVMAVGH